MDEIDRLLIDAEAVARGEIPGRADTALSTAGAFDLLWLRVHDADAFALSTVLCDRLARVAAAPAARDGYYRLLEALAHRSRTTEMPPGMADVIAADPERARGLCEWYRVTPETG